MANNITIIKNRMNKQMFKKLNQQHVIGVFNNKGGVGKSTSVNSLACCLASQGYKTLIIDSDSQSHQNQFFDPAHLITKKYLEDLIIQQQKINSEDLHTDIDNLFLLSNKKDISSRTFASFSALEQLQAVKNIIPDNEFDFILIDLPPTMDLPALNCLLACDYILSPVEYSELSKDGLLNLLSNFDKVKEYNPKLEFLGCFGSKVNNSFKNTDKYRQFYKQYPDIFLNSEIRQNQSLSNLPTQRKNIFQVNDIQAQTEYSDLIEEILSKIIKLKIK
jgi:chromosome partitioning protein